VVFKKMFDSFPTFFRLSLFMFFSVSLHGGVAFYEWATDSAESSLAVAPVVVSFVPATEVASPAVPELPQPKPDLVPAPAMPQVKKVEQTAPTPKVVSLPPKSAPAKALPKNAMTSVVPEEPQASTSSAEMVCMEPRDVVFEDLSELFEDSQPETASAGVASAENEAPDSAPQTLEKGLRDSAALSAYRSTLVEAIPNYRSNPLPEYPYLARQKHWEGVVWLLVDVTAEGLVDDLRVEKSCGHRVLDRAASKTVRRWQFSPAKRAGLPVSSQARIPVRFRLEDG
jgi:protein TonB